MKKNFGSRYALRKARGATTSIILLMACLLLLMLGSIGIDVSHAFYVRSQLQCACDNAALGGARCLANIAPVPMHKQECLRVATKILERSACDGSSIVADENTEIFIDTICKPIVSPNICKISVSKNVPTSLARLVGITTIPVSVTTQAAAFIGTTTVEPGRLINVAVSFRAKYGTVDVTPGKKEKTAISVGDWQGSNSPQLKVGETTLHAGSSSINQFLPGVLYMAPIVTGGDGEDTQPSTPTLIGTTGIIFDKFEDPYRAKVRYLPGAIMKGQPGTGNLAIAKPRDLDFALGLRPWRIILLH